MNITQPVQSGRRSLESDLYPGSNVESNGTRASWHQARDTDGKIYGKQLSWTSPYQKLCATQRECVDYNAPCYFLKLPTELRQEIFKYFVPEQAIDSLVIFKSTKASNHLSTSAPGGSLRTMFPTPLLSLLLGFNREVYVEVKHVFYNMATFTIDITKDGVRLCECFVTVLPGSPILTRFDIGGRRILGPMERDGYSCHNHEQQAVDRFIRYFPWTAVRNYDVSIALDRTRDTRGPRMGSHIRGREVELYDARGK